MTDRITIDRQVLINALQTLETLGLGKNTREFAIQQLREALQAKPVCNHCNGSGRMVRDPDIGTDQECFVCEGSGVCND